MSQRRPFHRPDRPRLHGDGNYLDVVRQDFKASAITSDMTGIRRRLAGRTCQRCREVKPTKGGSIRGNGAVFICKDCK